MLSITIRPRESNFKPEWQETLTTFFKREKYLIGLEKGNHLQIALQTKKRTNNMRRDIVKFLNFQPEDDDEARSWLIIKVHKEPVYLIGYCCKETKYLTNFSPEYIQDCIQFYEGKSATIEAVKKSHKWLCSSMNQLMPAVYHFAVKNKIQYKPLRTIVVLMFAHDLIPFSLTRKISSKDEDAWIAYREVQHGSSNNYIIDRIELISQ